MGSGNPVYPVLAGFIKTNKKLDFSYKTRWMKLPFKKVLGKIPSVPKKRYAGSYPEQISYQLTNMGIQKNVPKKQKVKFLSLTCLFTKREFNGTHKDFSINYTSSKKHGKTIFSF